MEQTRRQVYNIPGCRACGGDELSVVFEYNNVYAMGSPKPVYRDGVIVCKKCGHRTKHIEWLIEEEEKMSIETVMKEVPPGDGPAEIIAQGRIALWRWLWMHAGVRDLKIAQHDMVGMPKIYVIDQVHGQILARIHEKLGYPKPWQLLTPIVEDPEMKDAWNVGIDFTESFSATVYRSTVKVFLGPDPQVLSR